MLAIVANTSAMLHEVETVPGLAAQADERKTQQHR
jgi:hypothetical protein